MALPITRTPVEDTVPKVNHEIAVGEDVEFQRRWWKFEKITWIVFVVLVLLDLASLHFPRVNATGCVKVLTNFYSTPLAVGTAVEVKAYSSYMEIWHEGRLMARHERCHQRHQKVLQLEHYVDVLMHKPGALAGSTALEQCRAQGRWPSSYDQFWRQMAEREGRQAGTRAMVDVLLLAREHGSQRVREAVEEALEVGCANLGAIRYLLRVDRQETAPPIDPVDIGALSRYDRPRPSMDVYDQLRPGWTAAVTEVMQ